MLCKISGRLYLHWLTQSCLALLLTVAEPEPWHVDLLWLVLGHPKLIKLLPSPPWRGNDARALWTKNNNK